MNPRLLYLDSSAIVKLIVREVETAALFALLEQWPERVSSALARAEVLRALRRAGVSVADYQRGEELLGRFGLIRMDGETIAAAAVLDPPDLRTLDAIHLATALSVRDALAAVVTYDRRLAEAAQAANLTVWTPRVRP